MNCLRDEFAFLLRLARLAAAATVAVIVVVLERATTTNTATHIISPISFSPFTSEERHKYFAERHRPPALPCLIRLYRFIAVIVFFGIYLFLLAIAHSLSARSPLSLSLKLIMTNFIARPIKG